MDGILLRTSGDVHSPHLSQSRRNSRTEDTETWLRLRKFCVSPVPSPDYLGLQTVLQFPAVHCSEWSPGQTVLDDEDRVNKLSLDVTE